MLSPPRTQRSRVKAALCSSSTSEIHSQRGPATQAGGRWCEHQLETPRRTKIGAGRTDGCTARIHGCSHTHTHTHTSTAGRFPKRCSLLDFRLWLNNAALFCIRFCSCSPAAAQKQRGLHAGQKGTVLPNEDQLRGMETAPSPHGLVM